MVLLALYCYLYALYYGRGRAALEFWLDQCTCCYAEYEIDSYL